MIVNCMNNKVYLMVKKKKKQNGRGAGKEKR